MGIPRTLQGRQSNMMIFFRGYDNTTGSSFAFVEEFPDNTSETWLDSIAWDYAIENAQLYGEVIEELPEDYDYDTSPNYILLEDIGSRWEIYNPEKHGDML